MDTQSNLRPSLAARRIVTSAMGVVGLICVVVAFSAFSTPSEPDTRVRVASFEPSGTVPRETNITVTFSNRLVPVDSLDRPVPVPLLEFDPPLRGIARWIERDVLRFYPDEPLAPATEYTARVRSRETFLNGNKINDKRQFTFATAPLEVLNVSHRLTRDDVARLLATPVISVRFNYPVDIEQLSRKIAIEGEENAEHSHLSFEVRSINAPAVDEATATDGSAGESQGRCAAACEVVCQRISLGDQPQNYRFRIRRGLLCGGCGIALREDFTRVMTIRGVQPVVVERVTTQTRGNEQVMVVHFSEAIDAQALSEYLAVEPPGDYRVETAGRRAAIYGDFKPGETYEVTIRKGVPAANGTTLGRSFSTSVSVRDLKPSVAFTSAGAFLPRRGCGNIELTTTNVEELVVELEQVFENNLVYYLTGRFRSPYYRGGSLTNVGRRVFSKEKRLDGPRNVALSTTIDVASLVGDTVRGVFVVSARDKQRRWTSDRRQMMLTDIGISARLADDFLLVWVHSLADTRPLADADVRLISRNNQVLVEGKTDSRGVVSFDHLTGYTAGFEPFVITVAHKDDLSYLTFAECLLPTTESDVSGRPYLISGYEAYVYTDRGVYRPGDTLHLASILRSAKGSVPKELPVVLAVRDPQGRSLRKMQLRGNGSWIHGNDLVIPVYSPTGHYTVSATVGDDHDNEIGRADFLVEEFVPERLGVSLTTSRMIYSAGDRIDLEVRARFLFGPPAKGQRVAGHVTIEHVPFAPVGFSSYRFASGERRFSRQEYDLPDTLLNDSGAHTYTHCLPKRLQAPSSLRALLSAAVSEPGGRTVGAYHDVIVHPYQRYLGIRIDLDGRAEPGRLVTADLVAVSPDGEPISAQTVTARFYHVVYHSVLEQDARGRYRYVSKRSRHPVDSIQLTVPESGTEVSFTPPDFGKYQIEVTYGAGGHAATAEFYVSGWGSAPWSMENPDRIELDLDKDKYRPGSTAKVQVRAPFAGRLLLTVERERVLDLITVEMEGNTAEIALPVSGDYFPNVYLTASIIRPAHLVKRHMPARAFGICPLFLAVEHKRLPLTLEVPGVVKPRTSVQLHLSTGRPGAAEVAVALVDAGILQLTEYSPTDPIAFHYGKKRPLLQHYDMYSFIYPEVERASSHLSPAGGRTVAEARKRHLAPVAVRRVKPVALWSGVVVTDEDGHATVDFHIPQFNGRLVAMAVAAREDLFGAASAEITVRDNLVINESFPRFLAPNDLLEGLVTVYNNSGQRAEIQVTLSINGPARLVSDSVKYIALDDGAQGATVFKVEGDMQPGRVDCCIVARAGNDSSEVKFELPNRPGQPLRTEYGSGSVSEGKSARFLLPGGWFEGTDKCVVRTSSLSAVAFARNIQFLLAYPYGCLEQTTSRLFPLLYFDDLAKFVQPELLGGSGPAYFIQEGITKLASMAFSDGSFAFWPGTDRRNHWATVYASHFLAEARCRGFLIDDKLYQSVTENLRRIARGKGDDAYDIPQRIYAAFVLGKAGELDNRIMNDLKDRNTLTLPSYSRYQLAGALAAIGEREDALRLLPEEIQAHLFEPETGGNFNSSVRSGAILLDVILQIDPRNPSAAALAQSLMRDAGAGRCHTTQDNAFALMALGKFFQIWDNLGYEGSIRIDKDSTYNIDTSSFRLEREDLAGREVTITVQGDGTCFYYWQVSGVGRSHAAEEYDRGIRVRRLYLGEDGQPLDMNQVELGQRVICRIAVEAVDKTLRNVVINDLLPAAFEIENPRLKGSAVQSWVPKNTLQIDYQDIRDDRLLLFTDLHPGRVRHFYYSLRVTAAGDFMVPPIAAECMYNPLVAGAASSGRVKVRR